MGYVRALRLPVRGTAMLETALVLPLLLMVVVGLLQLALYRHAANVVTAAVQDGARVAAAESRTVEDGERHARALLGAGLGGGAADIRLAGDEQGNSVTFAASGEWPTIIPWVNGNTLPLEASATISKERFSPGGGTP